MTIKLKDITLENYWELLSLCVSKEQENFIASNAVSLAEAYVYEKNGDSVMPYAIYDGTDLIGFVMLAYDENIGISKGNYLLFRLMIDQNFQGKGYFRLIMDAVLNNLKSTGLSNLLWVSYEPENKHARCCYLNYGFVETGDLHEGELVAIYDLNKK
ncbi:GNAT family N-acetyltransferase [Streptococcus sp. ZY19097]|uniref:GNAT family N-acetyltransferase n=1 Tax=unclassified Streptococcus TaxID=2608887 RepID=UPI00345A180A